MSKRDYNDLLEREGYRFDRYTGKDHEVWKKGEDTVVIPKSPSDRRGLLNLRSLLKRLARRGGEEA